MALSHSTVVSHGCTLPLCRYSKLRLLSSPSLPLHFNKTVKRLESFHLPPPSAAAAASSYFPIDVEYLKREFSGHGATFEDIGETCVAKLKLDNGSSANVTLTRGMVTSYKVKVWHGGKVELLHTWVEQEEEEEVVIRGGVSSAFSSSDDTEEWSLHGITGDSENCVQVELRRSDKKIKDIEMKQIITLRGDTLSIELCVTNKGVSPISIKDGNPFLDWGTSVCSGKAHPDEIVSQEESLRAGKRRYYADLEKYHNDIIDYLQMLKEKWESCKDPEKDAVKKMWRRSREGNNARVNGSCQDITAASESSSWNEDDKPCNSYRAGEVRRRPKSSAVEKEKPQSPLIAQENVVNLGLKARNKDKLPKHSIQQTDGAKYMSYLKISKKQYQIVTSMKQSGKSIQSKALNKILGNINNLDVQPYGVFVEEEQKKLNAHWLQLVKDLPASYALWKKLQLQKRDVINSLEIELKDKLNPWMEVCSEKPLLKHDLGPVVEDSGSLGQVSAKNQSLSKESSSDSDQITDSGRCLQVGEHSSQVSSPDRDNSINFEANDYSSSINAQSLPEAPFPSEPHASNLGDANPGSKNYVPEELENASSDERIPSNSSSHGDELQYCSGGGDVWQPVGGTRQSYVGRQAYTPSGGLSIIHHPEGGEEEKNYFIEPVMPEEVDRRKMLQPRANNSFGSFPSNDQNELLQSLFKGQGGVASHSLLKAPLNEEHKQIMPIGFQQEGSNNLMEGSPFSAHFQHQMTAPQALSQDQPRQGDIYGQGSLPDNIYCDGRGFLMPRPDWNASVAQIGVTTQPPLNTGPLLNQNWQFKSMWANTNGVSQSSHNGSERDLNLLRVATNPEQMIHRGSSSDQSLFSVFSQCSQLRRSRSALEPESSSGQVVASGNYEMLMAGGTTQAGSSSAQPTNPLDYLSGSNNPAATSLMPDDVVWMNQSRENSGLHDPLGKLYPRSWNP